MPKASCVPKLGTRDRDSSGSVPTAGRGAVVVLVAMALLVLTQVYAAIPLLGPVGRSLGGDVTFALATIFSLSYAIGFVLWGALSDQYGRRPILLIGIAALVVATACCAFAWSVPVLAVMRAVQGVAAASFAPVALAYLSESLSPQRRPVAIGAMSTAFLVAGIVGQVGAQVISLTLGWPWVFAISAALLAIGLVAIAVTVHEPKRRRPTGALTDRFHEIGRLAVTPTVLWLSAAHVTLLGSFVAMYTALGPHLGTFGLDSSTVIWVRLVGLPGMFAAFAAGPLARRWGMSVVARIGFAVAAIGITAQALTATNLVAMAIASLIYVTGIALAVPAMITQFGAAAAPHPGGGMALNGLVLFAGASLGPLIAAVGLPFVVLLLTLGSVLALAAGCVSMSARTSVHR